VMAEEVVSQGLDEFQKSAYASAWVRLCRHAPYLWPFCTPRRFGGSGIGGATLHRLPDVSPEAHPQAPA
jgi:hypothetical protein